MFTLHCRTIGFSFHFKLVISHAFQQLYFINDIWKFARMSQQFVVFLGFEVVFLDQVSLSRRHESLIYDCSWHIFGLVCVTGSIFSCVLLFIRTFSCQDLKDKQTFGNKLSILVKIIIFEYQICMLLNIEKWQVTRKNSMLINHQHSNWSQFMYFVT